VDDRTTAWTLGAARGGLLAITGKSRSGTPTTPNAKRTRPMVSFTLSHEALARLEAIAEVRGMTKSGAVEALIRNACLREPSKT
jgi:hypothetical protein